jgi:hypothetical protein
MDNEETIGDGQRLNEKILRIINGVSQGGVCSYLINFTYHPDAGKIDYIICYL